MFTLEGVKYRNILEIPQLVFPQSGIVCLVGSSGSGKTTLLRLLNLMQSPTEGTIFYQGQDLAQKDAVEHRRNVVTVPQTPVMYPGSVEENLQRGRLFCQMPPASRKRLEEGLEAMRLNKALEEDVAMLSGGEKQRICLLRALLIDAQTYLLDEPTSALDQDTTGFVLEAFCKACTEQEKLLIMVTHDPGVAKRFGQTVITLKQGKVVQIQQKEEGMQ